RHSANHNRLERKTSYLIRLHQPNGQSAEEVEKAMVAATKRLPETLWKSLTWDQGWEMRNHAKISVATNLEIYFCDPASPWQRGSNENTNGLLRQYFPKGTDLSVHSAEHLAFVADEMNQRPRKTLDWLEPREALAQLFSESPRQSAVASTDGIHPPGSDDLCPNGGIAGGGVGLPGTRTGRGYPTRPENVRVGQ